MHIIMNAPKTKKSSEKTFNLLKEISPRIKIKESVIALGGRMNAARQIMSPDRERTDPISFFKIGNPDKKEIQWKSDLKMRPNYYRLVLFRSKDSATDIG